MSQEEMRATSQDSYRANKKYETAAKKLEGVLKVLKPLGEHPFEHVGLASSSEMDELVEAAEALPSLLREVKAKDTAREQALEAAQDAYNRHNGLDR